MIAFSIHAKTRAIDSNLLPPDLLQHRSVSAMERGEEWCRLTGKQGKRIVTRTESSRRNAFGQHASRLAEVCESPLANFAPARPKPRGIFFIGDGSIRAFTWWRDPVSGLLEPRAARHARRFCSFSHAQRPFAAELMRIAHATPVNWNYRMRNCPKT